MSEAATYASRLPAEAPGQRTTFAPRVRAARVGQDRFPASQRPLPLAGQRRACGLVLALDSGQMFAVQPRLAIDVAEPCPKAVVDDGFGHEDELGPGQLCCEAEVHVL